MTTPTGAEAVEQMAQVLEGMAEIAHTYDRKKAGEAYEKAAAMLRDLLLERDEFRTMANQMAAAQMAVNSMKSNARATALEEAADEFDRRRQAWHECAEYNRTAAYSDARDFCLRRAAQARQDSAA